MELSAFLGQQVWQAPCLGFLGFSPNILTLGSPMITILKFGEGRVLPGNRRLLANHWILITPLSLPTNLVLQILAVPGPGQLSPNGW